MDSDGDDVTEQVCKKFQKIFKKKFRFKANNCYRACAAKFLCICSDTWNYRTNCRTKCFSNWLENHFYLIACQLFISQKYFELFKLFFVETFLKIMLNNFSEALMLTKIFLLIGHHFYDRHCKWRWKLEKFFVLRKQKNCLIDDPWGCRQRLSAAWFSAI